MQTISQGMLSNHGPKPLFNYKVRHYWELSALALYESGIRHYEFWFMRAAAAALVAAATHGCKGSRWDVAACRACHITWALRLGSHRGSSSRVMHFALTFCSSSSRGSSDTNNNSSCEEPTTMPSAKWKRRVKGAQAQSDAGTAH